MLWSGGSTTTCALDGKIDDTVGGIGTADHLDTLNCASGNGHAYTQAPHDDGLRLYLHLSHYSLGTDCEHDHMR